MKALTLLVWGQEDRLVSPVYAQEFASRSPGARVEQLDQAGRMPAMAHPAPVVTVVREFWRDEQTPRTAS